MCVCMFLYVHVYECVISNKMVMEDFSGGDT